VRGNPAEQVQHESVCIPHGRRRLDQTNARQLAPTEQNQCANTHGSNETSSASKERKKKNFFFSKLLYHQHQRSIVKNKAFPLKSGPRNQQGNASLNPALDAKTARRTACRPTALQRPTPPWGGLAFSLRVGAVRPLGEAGFRVSRGQATSCQKWPVHPGAETFLRSDTDKGFRKTRWALSGDAAQALTLFDHLAQQVARTLHAAGPA